jgi:hypothetical protein
MSPLCRLFHVFAKCHERHAYVLLERHESKRLCKFRQFALETQ